LQVITVIKEIKKKIGNARTAVALGTFDGVHVGHSSIIQRAKELAEEIGGKSVVFTFSNHPLSVLAPAKEPMQLGDRLSKVYLMEQEGIDFLVNIPFTEKIASLSPIVFLVALKHYLHPAYVVVGPNFSFGAKGKGSPRMLLREGEKYGFQAEIAQEVQREGRIVSSTRIRNLVEDGDLEKTNEFLGHPFTVGGRVIHGDHRGNTIGFPTANLPIGKKRAMLPNGAYAVRAILKGESYYGIANIGDNPTFEGCNRRIEIHILDFDKDIYDEALLVEFCYKLRPQKKFSGIDALVAQLRQDERTARKLFKIN
jgi:riboflavin kinase/FMN adenylyltransferase